MWCWGNECNSSTSLLLFLHSLLTINHIASITMCVVCVMVHSGQLVFSPYDTVTWHPMLVDFRRWTTKESLYVYSLSCLHACLSVCCLYELFCVAVVQHCFIGLLRKQLKQQKMSYWPQWNNHKLGDFRLELKISMLIKFQRHLENNIYCKICSRIFQCKIFLENGHLSENFVCLSLCSVLATTWLRVGVN